MQGANLITGVLLARALPPDQRGSLASVTALTMTIAIIFGLSLGEGVLYHLSGLKGDKRGAVARSLVAAIGLGLVCAAVLNLYALVAQRLGWPVWPKMWLWSFYPAAYQLVVWSMAVARAMGRFRAWAILRMTSTGIYALILVLLVATSNVNIITVPLALAVGQIFTLILFAIMGVWAGGVVYWKDLDILGIKQQFSFGLRLHPAAVASVMREQGDKFLLAFLVPSHAIGIYVAGIAVGSLFTIVSNSIEQVLFPRLLSLEAGAARIDRALVSSRGGLLLLAAFGATVLPFHALLIAILFGSEYSVAPGIALAATMIGWLQACRSILAIPLKVEGKAAAVGANEAFGTVVALGLLLPLVATHGIVGAPMAALLGGCTSLGLCLLSISRLKEGSLSIIARPRPSDIANLMKW